MASPHGQTPFSALFSFLLPFLLYVYHGKRGSWPKVVVAVVQSLSHVPLFAAPWTVARQPPLSMGFLRQEYWSKIHYELLKYAFCLFLKCVIRMYM